MALGIVTGVLGAAQGIGGLFGGGGPRQPRMNGAQKQHLKSQANMNNAMANMMRMMTQMLGKMQHSMMGGRCGNPQGGCCQQGMNGANCCGGSGFNNGFPQNPMGNMFGGGGTNININLGGGGHFGTPPMMGAHFGMGINMFA
jgi:hypothetical protein